MLFHFCRHTYNKVANIIKIITKQKLLPISIFHNFNVCFQLHLELFASLDKVIYIVKKDVFSSLSLKMSSLSFFYQFYLFAKVVFALQLRRMQKAFSAVPAKLSQQSKLSSHYSPWNCCSGCFLFSPHFSKFHQLMSDSHKFYPGHTKLNKNLLGQVNMRSNDDVPNGTFSRAVFFIKYNFVAVFIWEI